MADEKSLVVAKVKFEYRSSKVYGSGSEEISVASLRFADAAIL
jgi:hypothetical protein